jgi:hypothetical protein
MTFFYTWHFSFSHDFDPRSITVIADSKEQAIKNVVECIKNSRVLSFRGPYTSDFNAIHRVDYLKDDGSVTSGTIGEMILESDPSITSTDCIIEVSALSG